MIACGAENAPEYIVSCCRPVRFASDKLSEIVSALIPAILSRDEARKTVWVPLTSDSDEADIEIRGASGPNATGLEPPNTAHSATSV